MFRNVKRFTAILLVLILAASTYAFAAANTMIDSNVGYGASDIRGFTVSAIVYDLTVSADPPTVNAVGFNLTTNDPSPTALSGPVYVAVNTTGNAATLPTAGTPNWANASCTFGASVAGAFIIWPVVCIFTTEPTVTAVISLDIVASTSLDTALLPLP